MLRFVVKLLFTFKTYMALLIFYLLLALIVSFICSVMEAVLLSTPVSFLEMKSNEGMKSAAHLKNFKNNIDKPLSAILSLNTIAHTIGAAGVGAQAVIVFKDVSFGVISAVLTILILVLSEIIPKTVGASYWRSLIPTAAVTIKWMVIICYPLVWFSELITRVISPKNKAASVSREEVSAMVNVGLSEGIFQSGENKIIQNLIKLTTVKAKDIMTPRIVVSTASESMTLREFYADKSLLQYSRIPVYGENNEDFTGYVLRQDVLEALTEDKFDVKLSEIKRPIQVFVDTYSLTLLWEHLLLHKEHISLIVDKYGSFEGVVTMEDVIESILGIEIIDEKDNVVDMQQYARERWKARKSKYKHLNINMD